MKLPELMKCELVSIFKYFKYNRLKFVVFF